MARIPTIQRRAQLPTTTGVPAAPIVQSRDQSGTRIKELGSVLLAMSEEQLKAKADKAVTDSYENAILKIDELKRKIATKQTLSWENNNFEAKAPTADQADVQQRMKQIYESAGAGLSSYGAEQFDRKFTLLSSEARIQITRDDVKRTNEELQAGTSKTLDTFLRDTIRNYSESKWQSNLDEGNKSIQNLIDKFQMGPKKAENLRQTWQTQMDAVKGDRLAANVENVAAKGIKNVDILEEEGAAKERLANLDKALEEAVGFGTYKRQTAAKRRLKFLEGVDDAMAHQQVEEDAAKFLKLEKNSGYLPNLDSKQRSQYAKRARTIIEQEERQTKTAANAKERTFVKAASDIIEALSVAANVAPELRAQVDDDAIDANVQDETTREKLKLLRTDAEEFSGVLQSIAGKTPAEILALEQQLTADLQGERGTVAQASLAEQDRRQLDAFLRAKAADSKARLDDPAQYVVSNNGAVGEAYTVWASAIQNPESDEDTVAFAYANYQAAREEAYS